MPTAEKVQAVEDMRKWMEQCSVVISTDYTGMPVSQMTNLRRALKDKGIEYRVIKNTLALRAADAAGKPAIKEIIQGPTGVAFAYGEPTEPAKALSDFIRTSRAPLKIIGGVLGNRAISAAQVDSLATLPPREQLLTQLLGQMQGPITNLVYVLNGPVSGLARVLQRHAEQMESSG